MSRKETGWKEFSDFSSCTEYRGFVHYTSVFTTVNAQNTYWKNTTAQMKGQRWSCCTCSDVLKFNYTHFSKYLAVWERRFQCRVTSKKKRMAMETWRHGHACLCKRPCETGQERERSLRKNTKGYAVFKKGSFVAIERDYFAMHKIYFMTWIVIIVWIIDICSR